MPHRTGHVEVLGTVALGHQLPRCHSGGRDQHIPRFGDPGDDAERLAPAHGKALGTRGPGPALADRVLRDEQSEAPACPGQLRGSIEHGVQLLGRLRHHLVWHLEGVQDGDRLRAHDPMLGLVVVGVRIGTSTDQQQNGDRVGENQRGEWIDQVPKAGVLEQRRAAPSRTYGTGGDRQSCALVGCRDVDGIRIGAGQLDQAHDVRAGHAGQQPVSPKLERAQDGVGRDHRRDSSTACIPCSSKSSERDAIRGSTGLELPAS